MIQQLRESMVEVGQETAPSTPNVDTRLFAFDNNTGLMKSVLPSSLPVSTDQDNAFTKKISESFTVTVGAGGNYSTLNLALEAISAHAPIYKSGGVIVTISMLSGYVITEQTILIGIDLSFVRIEGIDVETDINITTVTDSNAFMEGRNCHFPKIAQNFNILSGTALKRLMFVSDSSLSIEAYTSHRADPADEVYAILAAHSTVSAEDCTFDGFKVVCYAIRASQANMSYITASGFNGYEGAVQVRDGSVASVLNSSSSSPSVGPNVLVHVFDGGTASATGASGDIGQPANIVTSNGIIYQ